MFEGVDLDNIEILLRKLNLDRSVSPVSDLFKGGTNQAVKRFGAFVRHRLKHYDQHSNQPQTDDISHMSPYLHFGQISPLYLALKISRAPNALKASKDAYLEELVVRRELAMNFAFYTSNYDTFYAQLHAHVLGQEDFGMVVNAAKRIPHDPGDEQQILPGRARSQFIRRCGLELRGARSGLV